MDGTFVPMPVLSWTTASLMKSMMARRLGIKNDEAFGVFEITPEGGTAARVVVALPCPCLRPCLRLRLRLCPCPCPCR
jgi:hypothetical protein